MVKLSFSQWIILFTLFSMLGWLCESIWCSIGQKKIINRGFLHGPWCPIYGFGAVIIILTTIPFKAYPAAVFLIAMLTTSVLEYFTGWLLETLFKTRWWDYSRYRFQIKGRVCLLNSLIFGALGMLVTYFSCDIIDFLNPIPPKILRIIASFIVAILFYDLLKSVVEVTHLKELLENLRIAINRMEEYDSEQGWYDAHDIPGSIIRLQKICIQYPDDEVACGILKHIQDEMAKNKKTVRLVEAFPNMHSQRYSKELKTIRQQNRKLAPPTIKKLLQTIKRKLHTLVMEYKKIYKEITFVHIVWIFIIASVLGFMFETLVCAISKGIIESRQGVIYGPFNQIYGFGAIVIVLLLMPLRRKNNLWLFAGGALLGGVYEFVCRLIQQTVFASESWGYSKSVFQVFNGQINLLHLLTWGILTVIYIRAVHPRIISFINQISKRPKYFLTAVVTVLLAADMILSGLAVKRWGQRSKDNPAQNVVEIWVDENYPDELLEEIYPNLRFLKSSK